MIYLLTASLLCIIILVVLLIKQYRAKSWLNQINENSFRVYQKHMRNMTDEFEIYKEISQSRIKYDLNNLSNTNQDLIDIIEDYFFDIEDPIERIKIIQRTNGVVDRIKKYGGKVEFQIEINN